MDSVNKTLYIPLYGKDYVSRKGIILNDPKAQEIWRRRKFPLKGRSKSKWLAYYLGMRAAVYDRWVEEKLAQMPDAVVLHIGCGLDSRNLRVSTVGSCWYDIDVPEVIKERSRYFAPSKSYHMLAADVRDTGWLSNIPSGGDAVILMEGVSMYLFTEDLRKLMQRICSKFDRTVLLMDVYSEFAARASRIRNPIKDVGVTHVYGLDDPTVLEDTGFVFRMEHDMTPEDLISQLKGAEKFIFENLYSGAIARRMYRLYEYTHGDFPERNPAEDAPEITEEA